MVYKKGNSHILTIETGAYVGRCVMLQKMVTAVSALNLPKDVMLGEVLLSFVGNCCLVVENYRSIIRYEENEIWLQAKNCRIVVKGKHLCIVYYDKEQMKITGNIQAVEFVA